jgi:hypothetical protein
VGEAALAHGLANEYKDQVVELSRLAVNSTLLEDLTFVGCQIVGPAVVVPLEDVQLIDCSWDAPNEKALFWIIDDDRSELVGAIGLRNCIFTACNFRDIGLGVPESRVEETLKGFGR